MLYSCGEKGMDPIRRQQKNVWASSNLFPLLSQAVNKYRRYQFLKSYTTERGVGGAYSTVHTTHYTALDIIYPMISSHPPEHGTIKCFRMIWVHQPAIQIVERQKKGKGGSYWRCLSWVERGGRTPIIRHQKLWASSFIFAWRNNLLFVYPSEFSNGRGEGCPT